jgi:Transposase DDE domain
MRDTVVCIPGYLIVLIESLRARLRDPDFLDRHRRRPEDFTRERCLPFAVVMLMILQKSLQSVQRHLDEFLADWARGRPCTPASPSAWTQARAKLRASAFEELNRDCVLPLVYGPEAAPRCQRWHGHRLLGLDGSAVRLPYSASLAQSFQVLAVHNGHGPVGPRYCAGRLSVLYDLLNHVGLDGRLVSAAVGELSLAEEQLVHLEPGDVVLMDRGYTGYRLLAQMRQRGADFVSRCSRASFFTAQGLFAQNRAGQSVVTRLWADARDRAQFRKLGLPLQLSVRFITLRLPDGQLEVLVTSLVDEPAYPTAELGLLYGRRWGQETYHFLLKSRLDLENWSGQTPAAVEQDFAATVLLANLESLLSRPAAAVLAERSADHQPGQQVNRAVSYHAIKDQVLDLLTGPQPVTEVIEPLQQLFLGSPVRVRSRTKKRRKPSFSRSYYFQRCRRKIVF